MANSNDFYVIFCDGDFDGIHQSAAVLAKETRDLTKMGFLV